MGLGMTEIILIFLVVLLFFGAKRLPEVARSMGKAVNEFKKAKGEILNAPVAQAVPEQPENTQKPENTVQESPTLPEPTSSKQA